MGDGPGHEVARMRCFGKRRQPQWHQAWHGELSVFPARLRPLPGPRIGGRDAPELKRRRPQAETKNQPRGFGCRMRTDMGADRGAGGRADRRHPARIFLRRVLRLLVHRVGVAGGDECQRIVTVDPCDRHFVGHAAEIDSHTVGKRGSDAVAHLHMIAIDRDSAVRAEFHTPERTIRAGAVVLGDAGNAGTDKSSVLLRTGFFQRALLPDRMLFELVQNLGGANRNAVRISRHGPAIRLERIAPPELDRIERQRRCRFVDQYFERCHRLQRSVATHRSRCHAAGMECHRGNVDFRNVIDADRGGGSNDGHAGREIGEAATVQHMIRGESLDLAGCAVDPDPRTHPDRVPFDAALKLLIPIMREPDRPAGKKHRRQCDIEHEWRVVAPTKAAAYVGELRVDARRLERRAGLAEQERD